MEKLALVLLEFHYKFSKCPQPNARNVGHISTDLHVGIGGAKRDRTADLLHAMQALSQLSYGPDARPGDGAPGIVATNV